MKVEVTDLSPVKKRMSIEVGADVVAREAEEVLRSYARKAKIPGFRPGKVPLSVIRSRFAQELDQDVRERVVSHAYSEAAKERGLEPLGDPVLDEVDYAEGQPLRFQTTFEVLPTIELKNYKDVSVRQPAARVDEGEVEKILEELRQSRVQLIAEEGAEAATGHVLVADVEGTPQTGEPFRRERMLIEVGAPEHLPAFNEQLTGAKAGEQREFSVDYPKEYEHPPLAGQSVRYRVVVHEVKRKQIPDLDDEFAKDLGDFADLAALRERVRDDLLERRRQEIERGVRQSVLDKVLLENPIVLPDVLVEHEVRHRLESIVRNMILQGVDPEKVQLDWEKLRTEQEEPARKSVHARLILDRVAEVESLSIDTAEVEERIRRDAQRIGEKPDKLRRQLEKRGGLEGLKAQLVREKSLDLLRAVANIQNEE